MIDVELRGVDDAQVGRWTAKDPILFAGGQTNLYVYADNDPINLTDAAGTDGNDYGENDFSQKLNRGSKLLQDKAKDAINKYIKKQGEKGICYGAACVGKKGKPQISVGGEAKLEVSGKEVLSAEGECSVGVTTEGTASDPLFVAKVKVEAKSPPLSKIPIIGEKLKVKYEKEVKFGQVENYHGRSSQTVHANAPHTSSGEFTGEGFTGN